MVVSPPGVGERRSVKHTVYFYVRPGTVLGDIDFARYLAKFLKVREHEGWRFERFLRYWKTNGAVITEKGDLADEWNMEILLSRPAERKVLEVPSSFVPHLLATGKFKEV